MAYSFSLDWPVGAGFWVLMSQDLSRAFCLETGTPSIQPDRGGLGEKWGLPERKSEARKPTPQDSH